MVPTAVSQLAITTFLPAVDIPLTQAGNRTRSRANPETLTEATTHYFPTSARRIVLDPATGNRSYAANGYYGQTERLPL